MPLFWKTLRKVCHYSRYSPVCTDSLITLSKVASQMIGKQRFRSTDKSINLFLYRLYVTLLENVVVFMFDAVHVDCYQLIIRYNENNSQLLAFQKYR